MLLKFCTQYQQIWKIQQWPQHWKKSDFIPVAKKGNVKEYSNYHATAHFTCQEGYAQNLSSQASIICEPRTTKMYKLDLEKAEESEIKLPTSVGSQKKQENSRKTSTYASLTILKPLTLWITTNWKILKEMEISDHLTCLLRNLYAGQEATVRTRHRTTD